MGAIFRVKIIETDNLVQTLREIKKNKFKVVVTSLDTEDSIYNIDYKKKSNSNWKRSQWGIKRSTGIS